MSWFWASPLSIVLDISKHIEVEQKLGNGEVVEAKIRGIFDALTGTCITSLQFLMLFHSSKPVTFLQKWMKLTDGCVAWAECLLTWGLCLFNRKLSKKAGFSLRRSVSCVWKMLKIGYSGLQWFIIWNCIKDNYSIYPLRGDHEDHDLSRRTNVSMLFIKKTWVYHSLPIFCWLSTIWQFNMAKEST